MHFLHSTIAARRSIASCATLHRTLPLRFYSTEPARPNPQIHIHANEHILTFLRARLAHQARLVKTRKETELAWLEKRHDSRLTKMEQMSETYWSAVREQKVLERGIEAVTRHGRPIQSVEQARKVIGMTEELLPRIYRILKGEEVSLSQRRSGR